MGQKGGTMTSAFKTLDTLDLTGKRVLLRADLNVPVADGKVTDATRIERLVPTIREIVKKDGKVILLSHFGRPKGKVDPAFSLEIVCAAVANETGHPVGFVATDWTDVSAAKQAIEEAPAGSVLVLENTRFHPGEEANDIELAKRMASLGDIYVNDAFSAAHRAHASTEALAHLLPAAAGLAMQAELEALEAGLGKPKKPVVAVVGGAKVSSKIDLLENLVTKVDGLVIGGGMANTFLHAQGFGIGKSLAEKDLAETALRIMDKAIDSGCAIILPIDGVVSWHFAANAPHRLYGVDAMDPDGMMLDIGPSSIERIKGAIDDAHTLVWNGPLGAFEMTPFDAGTVEVAKHVAARTKAGLLVSVAGGGDTVSALAHAGVKDAFSYVSTAGGAFLEWMEGKPLPGVLALKRA
jgi:phosphoglycerate kinase